MGSVLPVSFAFRTRKLHETNECVGGPRANKSMFTAFCSVFYVDIRSLTPSPPTRLLLFMYLPEDSLVVVSFSRNHMMKDNRVDHG